MVYNKSRPYLILLLLIPFLPCKLYSYDCIYYIYQWHSPLNVKYMWALATLTMHVCNILAFNISAVFSVPSNCVLNSSVFHVQKHGLFQNPLFLSQETNLNCVFFSLNVTFSTSLCYFKLWYMLVVFWWTVAQNTRMMFKLLWSNISCFFLRVHFLLFVKVSPLFLLSSMEENE